MNKREQKTYDIAVVGAGMAGMSAALFAANRGLSVVLAGKTSEIVFASGLLDLMAVYPVETGHLWGNPWEAIKHLGQQNHDHPYTRISIASIKESLEEFITGLDQGGLSYRVDQGQNSEIVTSMGTVKSSWGVPASMWNGVKAYREKRSCLLVDFKGLKGFSARQIAETLKSKWPNINTVGLSFPETPATGDLFPEHLARLMDNSHVREKLAALLKPHIKGVDFIGMPPILGIYKTNEILSHLEELTGASIFEIPSLPPSVPGLRLKETLEKVLDQKGVYQLRQKMVQRVRTNSEGNFELHIGDETIPFCSKGVILATGRFMGKGLHAGRQGIRETVFNLPVTQPDTRNTWHNKDFLHASGNPVNYAGIVTDAQLRPLNVEGGPAYKNLYAAGSILAYQDWKRMKCGSGLAISTACAAVNSFVKNTCAKDFVQSEKDRETLNQKAS